MRETSVQERTAGGEGGYLLRVIRGLNFERTLVDKAVPNRYFCYSRIAVQFFKYTWYLVSTFRKNSLFSLPLRFQLYVLI